MFKFNPFKKAKSKVSATALGMMQKKAMKKLAKMSPQEQQKLAQEAFKPKNKEKMLSVMEQMRKAGQITEEQYRTAKQRLGK
ncbi:MAG TPA: hypothetical protein ENL05_00445 [Candidatus Moranbacteria bacterium]|nr:hypothetical protein [Candidatus Moranbacteria bacterium]